MTIQRHIVCDACGESFWHEVERRSDPNPSDCPICHNTGEIVLKWPKKDLLSPAIAKMVEEGRGPATSSRFAKSGDQVYRQIEDSSHARSLMAAAALGVDASETAHMRVTDMRDGLRSGDTAAKLPPNPVSEAMSRGQNTGFVSSPMMPGGQPIATGSMGGAGISALEHYVKPGHNSRQKTVPAVGEQGRYSGRK